MLVYSRAGYGASTPVTLPRPLDYMHIEALETLPKLLDAIGFRRGILLGHSDGASIAAIYAGGAGDHRVRGVAMIAPHFVVEEVGIRSIAETRKAYETAGLKSKLERWHRDVDNTFYGWNDAWLDPGFAPGTSRNISPISAYRSRSCRAPTTSMGLFARSKSPRKRAIVRSM